MKQQDNKEGLAEEMRLNKFVAQSGICSRREAALFNKGRKIEVNGAILKEPGYLTKATDVVKYKGEKLSVTNKLVYLLVNKPKTP
jgi:16S rRNA uridine-516 pseudouridylate synthase and related pseudouridylate synthases